MRIQKKNFYDYSWKSNPNAVYVGRPTKWGNPFPVKEYGLELCLVKYRFWLLEQLKKDPNFLEPLRGKDLVCFCKLNQPCHADIITEFLVTKKVTFYDYVENCTCPYCASIKTIIDREERSHINSFKIEDNKQDNAGEQTK